ncbi:histidine phosphatase family protein [Actinocorallia populi]|uniref:histidine phosphatase family protein n=1 Tax=Actinocorallia populi TaxID=2079200 RepID=UPI000D08B6EF|nr:histidine phosphatase family protein [Actinocorallia populi]
MPVVHLVRHGQASFEAEDYDVLSDLGRRQAEIAGAELARRGLREPLVVCGTLSRQRDTAELLMKGAGLDGRPRIDARWNEYDHIELLRRYGREPDESSADRQGFQQLLDHALTAWISDVDHGGWEGFRTGARTALEELIAELGPGRDAVVVTSGGVLSAVCGSLLSASPAGTVALHKVVVNAAITTITAGRSGIGLLAFNDHAHFTGERRALLTYR